MFGNLLNNYFYGKAGKGDYSVSDMPKNRIELWGSVLKVRWSSMFGVNLLYMVSCIPAIIWTIINLVLFLSADSPIENEQLTSYVTYYLLLLAPCLFLTGPFNAGIAYVMRNWARDEHSFVWSDFWEAVKGNWKQAFVVSAISGILPVTLFVGYMFYGQMAASSSVLYMIPFGLILVVFALWKLSEMIVYTMMVTYELSIGNLLRNAILLTLARLPVAIGIKLVTLAIPILAFLLILFAPGIQIYVFLVAFLLYLLFMPAFNRLILASYSNAQCERYLNTKIEGARTDIGLRPENWDDTEYIPEDDEL